jgi:hypothetical protein
MYLVKKSSDDRKKKQEVVINHDKNIEYQPPPSPSPPPSPEKNDYTSGTFRIKPKHTINEEEEEGDDEVLENFNAPKTQNGNVRQSIGDEDVLNSRSPMSFIDKLQKRFDSSN